MGWGNTDATTERRKASLCAISYVLDFRVTIDEWVLTPWLDPSLKMVWFCLEVFTFQINRQRGRAGWRENSLSDSSDE